MPSDRPRALIPKFKCLLRCILPSLFSISFRRGDGYTFLLKRAVRWIPVKIMILGQPSLFSRTRQARPGRVNRRTGGRRAAGSVAVSSVGVISAVQRSEFDSLRAVEVRETSSLQCEGEDVPVSNRNTDPLLKDSASEKASAAQTNPIEKRTVPVPISLTVCTTRKGDSKRSLLIYATGVSTWRCTRSSIAERLPGDRPIGPGKKASERRTNDDPIRQEKEEEEELIRTESNDYEIHNGGRRSAGEST
ncbi:hypothetical protein NE237_023192 [Protea cynaroides]|uniref:Uncharacterized protein n=1 Tax=Protea cynaroides TaxID=273540 RepID=A0A9Q0HBR8_9MAGN|nr:hypothetical protein NE237_023192 [Protea cynaroides]